MGRNHRRLMKTHTRYSLLTRLAILPLLLAVGATAQVTPEEAIGWHLFFDDILSGPKNFSCGTCHLPEKGYEGGEALSKGAHDDVLRSGPTGTGAWRTRADPPLDQVRSPDAAAAAVVHR